MNLVHRKSNRYGLILIEAFLSILTLFLLFFITYPILQELIERSRTNQILNRLLEIRYYANKHFENHTSNSVSIYEFIGPKKVIPELLIIYDEEYPETIFRDKEISAYSKKYGIITLN